MDGKRHERLRTRIEVSSELAVVAMADVSAALPRSAAADALLRELGARAREGGAFFLVADDPVRYRLDVFVDEAPPPELERELEPSAGAFRLEAPGGDLAVSGWSASGEPVEAGRLAVPPGSLQVSLWSRRPFDARRHDEDMRRLVGEDWAFVQRVDRLGLLGCLPTLLVGVCVLLQRWGWLLVALPVLAAAWLPYAVLKRSPRYRRGEAAARELEESRPHFCLIVRAGAPPELPGGFLRV